MMMQVLNLPTCSLKVILRNGIHYIWDCYAGKYRVLSPEEWVRQHLLHYLDEHLGYPAGLMSTECPMVKIGAYWHRADIVIHRPPEQVWLIAECKAPHVRIDQAALEQLMRYNQKKSILLLLSNGLQHYAFQWQENTKKYHILSSVPTYHEIYATIQK